jgi:hypothetical protein
MKVLKKLTLLRCKTFNHKWEYYNVDGGYFRVCRHCYEMNERKIVNPMSKKYVWSISTHYTPYGASKMVPDYEA